MAGPRGTRGQHDGAPAVTSCHHRGSRGRAGARSCRPPSPDGEDGDEAKPESPALPTSPGRRRLDLALPTFASGALCLGEAFVVDGARDGVRFERVHRDVPS
ncbi:hypothetical protein GCM10009718_03950 [Isoptericola halotolerans]